MSVLRQIGEEFSSWLDSVAATSVALFGKVVSRRGVQLVEERTGVFALQDRGHAAIPTERLTITDGQVVGELPANLATTLRGSRVELVLQPSRFLFRPLELPGRAAEFLEGVVRSQVDRLTPWTAADAVFGCTIPVPAGPERIVVTVAATARAMVMPLVQALASAGAASVALSTLPQNAGPTTVPIKVFDESARGAIDVRRVRRVLAAVLLIAILGTGAVVGAAAVLGARYAHAQDELVRQIAARRSAILGARDGTLDGATAAQRALERRKHETPLTVLVLETLSRILPDHTYVTELRIEGDKLRLIGLTKDAPSLIGILEQSAQFTRAMFFAPTTRAPNETGERFHIEARIEPMIGPRS
jgi:general secretion pathway protein L